MQIKRGNAALKQKSLFIEGCFYRLLFIEKVHLKNCFEFFLAIKALDYNKKLPHIVNKVREHYNP
jgi:hypothetical protein